MSIFQKISQVPEGLMIVTMAFKIHVQSVFELSTYINMEPIIDSINSLELFFCFLTKHRFMSYLNYGLLKVFSSVLEIEDSDNKIRDYEIQFNEFCENPLFIDMIRSISDRIQPADIVGLPDGAWPLE